MANPTALTDKPAVLDTGTVEDSVTLDPRRAYSVAHDGEDNTGKADGATVYLALSASTDADGSEGDDKVKLISGRAVVIGPKVDTLKFKTAAGGPTISVIPTGNVLSDPAEGGARISQGSPGGSTVDSVATSIVQQMGGIAEDTVPTEVADGDTVALWMRRFGELVIFGADLSSGSIQVMPIAAAPRASATVTHAQLTAPGDSAAFDTSLYGETTYQITVAAIDTNVIAGIKMSDDGTSFGRISLVDADDQVVAGAIDEEQLTITANGTYFLRIRGQSKEQKFTFEAESGGTAATIDVVAMAGN